MPAKKKATSRKATSKKAPAGKKPGKIVPIVSDPAESKYGLMVALFQGPVDDAFAKRHPVVARLIEIRGDQTLEDLHWAIFKAHDREEAHLYEFQLGGDGPYDPKATRYGPPEAIDDNAFGALNGEPDGKVLDATTTKIANLGLKIDDIFGYIFDFGDEWVHQIAVESIDPADKRAKYPRVAKRIGKSPPQYPEW